MITYKYKWKSSTLITMTCYIDVLSIFQAQTLKFANTGFLTMASIQPYIFEAEIPKPRAVVDLTEVELEAMITSGLLALDVPLPTPRDNRDIDKCDFDGSESFSGITKEELDAELDAYQAARGTFHGYYDVGYSDDNFI